MREGSWAGVTSGTTDHTCTTATALQLHCTSGCHGFVCVFSPVERNVGRSPVRSVEVTPSKSLCKRKTKGWNRDTAVSETTQPPVDSSGGLYNDQSSWPVQCDRRVKASGTQMYWPIRDGRVKSSGSPVKTWPVITQRWQESEGCWKSCATHLTQWALQEQLVHGSPRDCWARRGLLHKWLQGPKRSAAQEVVFQSTGLRDLEGVPRFTVLPATVGPKRPAAWEF